MKKILTSILTLSLIAMAGCAGKSKNEAKVFGESLPRVEQQDQQLLDSLTAFWNAAGRDSLDVHSIMVVKGGDVVYEKWAQGHQPDEKHILNSVSKTFTSAAIGMAIDEGKLKLVDPVISFFTDNLPDSISDNLAAMTVRDLLTMTCGHDTDHTYEMQRMDSTVNWVTQFLSYPVEHKPGTEYCYNSVGTFMLSAIIQQVTGQNLLDYLQPRLFEPLGIKNVRWDSNSQGIAYGGWGLYLATEDLAKMGQLLLQKGNWNGKQLISEDYVNEMTKYQVPSRQAGMTDEQMAEAGMTKENSDWLQGYGYQMWRCRHNGVRADGYKGQYIIVLPDQDAVVAMTADILDMQKEINLVWDYIFPIISK